MNKSLYRNQKEEEPQEHREVRLRIEELLRRDSFVILPNTKNILKTAIGERTYEPDIYCYKNGQFLVVEIDGLSHGSNTYSEATSRKFKDDVRDEAFAEAGIPTCRFEVDEGRGKFAMSDSEIMERIRETLSSSSKVKRI